MTCKPQWDAETQSIPSGLPLFPNVRRRPLRSTPGHQLECDTAAGHHGHRSGYPAGEHQLPGPQALPLAASWLASHATDAAGWPIIAAHPGGG